MPKHINELDRLSKYYAITDIGKIKKFIEEHTEILDYITEISPLLNNYFRDYQKIIEFCEDSKTSDLDFLMIYIKGSVFDEDNETLKKFKREPLYRSKYSKTLTDQYAWSYGSYITYDVGKNYIILDDYHTD